MNRQYGAKRMSGKGMKRWFILGGVLILLTGGSLQYVYVAKHHPERLERFFLQVSGLTHWFADRKDRLKTGIDKKLTDIKTMSAAKSEDEDVNFEFYTALPEMQLSVARTDTSKVPVEIKTTAEEKKVSSDSAVAKTTVLSSAKSQAVKPLFLDPDELERDFASRLKPQNYVIQLGVFSSVTTATIFKQKLAAEHYAVELIKAYVGERHVYRVQLGPFTSKQQVEAAQHSLHNKGFEGIVRKIS